VGCIPQQLKFRHRFDVALDQKALGVNHEIGGAIFHRTALAVALARVYDECVLLRRGVMQHSANVALLDRPDGAADWGEVLQKVQWFLSLSV